MPIKVFCEICGSKMGVVSIKNIKDYYQKYGERCADCKKMEDKLINFVEKKKGYVMRKYDLLVKEMTELMHEEVNKLVRERATTESVIPNKLDGEDKE